MLFTVPPGSNWFIGSTMAIMVTAALVLLAAYYCWLKRLPVIIATCMTMAFYGAFLSLATEAALGLVHFPDDRLRYLHLCGGSSAMGGFLLALAWVTTRVLINRRKIPGLLRRSVLS